MGSPDWSRLLRAKQMLISKSTTAVDLLLGYMRTLEYVKLLSASELCSANP